MFPKESIPKRPRRKNKTVYPIFMDRFEKIGTLSWNDDFSDQSAFIKVYSTYIHSIKTRRIVVMIFLNQ